MNTSILSLVEYTNYSPLVIPNLFVQLLDPGFSHDCFGIYKREEVICMTCKARFKNFCNFHPDFLEHLLWASLSQEKKPDYQETRKFANHVGRERERERFLTSPMPDVWVKKHLDGSRLSYSLTTTKWETRTTHRSLSVPRTMSDSNKLFH